MLDHFLPFGSYKQLSIENALLYPSLRVLHLSEFPLGSCQEERCLDPRAHAFFSFNESCQTTLKGDEQVRTPSMECDDLVLTWLNLPFGETQPLSFH